MEPPPPSQRILIFGATGKIGTYITSAIANASPPFARVAIYTSANTVAAKAAHIEALKARGVDVVVGELDDDDKIKETYQDFDTIISCLGRAILSHQTRLIRLAALASSPIRRFFPSEYGTDVLHPVTPDPHAEPPHRYKLEARALLERLASGETEGDAVVVGKGEGEKGEKVGKSLSYTYIVTGPYAEFYVAPTGQRGVEGGAMAWDRAGGFDVVNRRATLLTRHADGGEGEGGGRAEGQGTDPIALTTMPDTAHFVVCALRHPQQTHNRALRCHSFNTTPRAILSAFEAQTSGPGTWAVTYLHLDELHERERAAYARGDAEKGLFSVRRIWTMGGSVYEGWEEGRGWDDGEGEGWVDREGWTAGTLEEVVRGEVERQMREEREGEEV
ncbi:uncharacterized protein J3D65DRAFT_676946 [Phyllosticta citribraziliensis]|uniref:NmrA-like domain-containing protein n=1 Tax=Phyllosticta citribraziliensis TaxID=989973 RepID=A0ABR1LSD0_9PEZI